MSSDISHVDVGSHYFRRLGLFRWRDCRYCYLGKRRHPTLGWTKARPMRAPSFIPRYVTVTLALLCLAVALFIVTADADGTSQARPAATYQGKSAKWWAGKAVENRKSLNKRGRTIKRLRSAQARRGDHFFGWLANADCVYRHERGADGWKTRTGNGYYGGMQADLDFQDAYGSDYRRRWGTADQWPYWAQLHMSYRGWLARGWEPWPNTARTCGLR